MKRIEGLDHAVDLFGAGKAGFKAEMPGISLGTEVTAEWLNGVQEALVRTIEAAGYVLSEADFDQFTDALDLLMQQKIDALVNGAPGVLDTLYEIAASLGNDANIATTMANAFAAINIDIAAIQTALLTKEPKFAAGTRLLFQQTAAPAGWTKVVTHNDKLLRVVSGAAGSGGAVAFSAAFVNGSVGATALSEAQIPSHSHAGVPLAGADGDRGVGNSSLFSIDGTGSTEATGGSATHTHSLNLDVSYVDIIIASKD